MQKRTMGRSVSGEREGSGKGEELTHREVSSPSVERDGPNDEAYNCDTFGDGKMPGSLVEATGAGSPKDGDYAGEEIWRCHERAEFGQYSVCARLVYYTNSQRDLLILETQSLNDSRQEVLETICGKMHMLHENK